MTSVFAELKRRNVFRVAVAYVVVGWVVLQAAEILSPLLQLPEWTISLVFYFGVIGFPFALIFAWAFELTPEGLKLTAAVQPEESITSETGKALNRTIIGLMAVAIVLLLAERFYNGLDTTSESPVADAQEQEATVEAGPKSIAVLPFVNMSTDPDQEYFSDGISEELLNGLAQIRELRVAARTSSFAFKGQNQDIKGIGEQLDVDTVLEGSVRKAGTRVRITAQLINVEDGYHLWSDTYDRELDDIFAIQDEISGAIVDALKLHLTDGESATTHRAVDLEAYNFFLQGQHSFRRRTEKSLQLAVKQFQKAIDIQPDYAEAWAGKAAATELLSEFHYGTEPVEETRRRAQAMLDRAFAIDPDLPRAHAVQALLDLNHGEPHAALESINKAIAANPSEGILYAWKSISLDAVGRHDEGDKALYQAYRIDPLHQTIRHNLAVTYAFRGQHARAREMVTPETELAYEVEFAIAASEGRFADTVPALTRAIELAEAGYDYRLSSTLANMLYFRLQAPNRAAEHANPMMLTFFEAAARPAETVERLQQIPAERRGHAIEDALAYALLELGRCEDLLEVYAGRRYLDESVPLWGDLNGGGNNIDDAATYAWCLKQLGREQEALHLAERLLDYIDTAVANGVAPRYFDTLASVQVLLGEEDEAIGSLKLALQYYDLGWFGFTSPLFAPLRAREDFQELRAEVLEHTNAERAKLGWEPVTLAALD